MKSIKKISLVALAAIFSLSFASAQVGLQVGYSSSKSTDAVKDLSGVYFGPTYNLKIQGPISLQYGLYYNYLTATYTGTYLGAETTSTTTAHRLDLPIRVAATFPMSGAVRAFIFGGPNFNYALSQKVDNVTDFWGFGTGIVEGESIYKAEMDDGRKVYSPFDLQLGAGAGLQFNQVSVRFSYDWGMLDRNNRDNSIWKNNDMKIGVAYTF